LLRKDGLTKPAYTELLKLIKGEWWIPPTKLTTNANGQIQLSCFSGEYELAYENIKTTFSVLKDNITAIALAL
jgi:hypothetical protein